MMSSTSRTAPSCSATELVLRDHTGRYELRADAISLRPVLRSSCAVARIDQALHAGSREVRAARASKPLFRLELRNTEDARQRAKLRAEARGTADLSGIARRVYVSRQCLQNCHCFGRTEIIVHPFLKALRVRPRLERVNDRQIAKRRIQAAQRRLGLLKLLEGIIDRPTIMTR